jgi:LacI family transcriptional regulator
MSPKKITIKDIARDCGVGLGTVSRVVNSQPGVKDEVRRKVLQYIEDIGWRSNSLKNRLKLPEPGKSVVFIASTSILERKYDQDLLRVVLERVISNGFSPMTLFGQCRVNLERCLSLKPFAVIIAGVSSFQKEQVEKLLNSGIRVVCLGECDVYAGPLIFPDYRKAAGKAVKLLEKHGHNRIGFFGGLGIVKRVKQMEKVNIRRIREMLTGITSVKPDFSLEDDVVSDCFCDLSGLKRKLQKGGHSAWICSDEKMCRQLSNCASGLGISVPEKLALVGFTQDLPDYSFHVDVTRFYPDNKSQAAKVIEILCSEDVCASGEYTFACRFHAGNTIGELPE